MGKGYGLIFSVFWFSGKKNRSVTFLPDRTTKAGGAKSEKIPRWEKYRCTALLQFCYAPLHLNNSKISSWVKSNLARLEIRHSVILPLMGRVLWLGNVVMIYQKLFVILAPVWMLNHSDFKKYCKRNKILKRPRMEAVIGQWIHLCLPSCGAGFEYQAHNLRFFQFLIELWSEQDEN